MPEIGGRRHCVPGYRKSTTAQRWRFRGMETRLTRRPGQAGTKKLLARYGERLIAVRYRYDDARNCRHKTVELIVETVPWKAQPRAPRVRDEEMVAVRIAFSETDLRERAKRLGAIWRPQSRVWEMRWLDAKNLGVADRVVRP